jgi:hypothetical protein
MGFLHELVGEEFSIQPVMLMNPDAAALRAMVNDLAKLQKEINRRPEPTPANSRGDISRTFSWLASYQSYRTACSRT